MENIFVPVFFAIVVSIFSEYMKSNSLKSVIVSLFIIGAGILSGIILRLATGGIIREVVIFMLFVYAVFSGLTLLKWKFLHIWLLLSPTMLIIAILISLPNKWVDFFYVKFFKIWKFNCETYCTASLFFLKNLCYNY